MEQGQIELHLAHIIRHEFPDIKLNRAIKYPIPYDIPQPYA